MSGFDGAIARIGQITSRIDAIRPTTPAGTGSFGATLDRVMGGDGEAAPAPGGGAGPLGFSPEITLGQFMAFAMGADPSAVIPLVSFAGLGGTSHSHGTSVAKPTEIAASAVQGSAPGGWVKNLPQAGREYAPLIKDAAAAAGIDPRLLAAIVWAESTFVPDAVSSAGAIGLTQLMPGTAAGLGVDPWNPAENLAGGARYIAEQLDRFERVDLALAAYNAGPGRVVETGGAPTYTHAYINRVMDYYGRLGGDL